MAGIVSMGVHIPIYRLSREEIARAWEARSGSGEKAVAGYDEDSITMAVAATLGSLKHGGQPADGLFFATTTSPYKEKLAAAIISSAVDLPRQVRTADFTSSLRAATIALGAATDAVNGGAAQNVVVVAADRRLGVARSRYEMELGDAAAAVTIGGDDVIASIDGSYTVFNEMFDTWRTEQDTFVRSGEERFTASQGYQKTMQEAVSGLMAKYGLAAKDFARVVLYAPDARAQLALARKLGFDTKTQLQPSLYEAIGNTGAPAVLIMLAAALETAKPGDKILLVGYGDGADAFLLSVTENIARVQGQPKIKDYLVQKTPVSYQKYATWRGLITTEASRVGGIIVPSVTALWRERQSILALYGVRCRRCGTPQYPPTRVCVVCQAKDDFEDYRFSDKQGKVFTYAIDYLAITDYPPGINAAVDFDGGGRIMCDITDCDPEMVTVGMPVTMTFRRISQSGGVNNYFWKARPVV